MSIDQQLAAAVVAEMQTDAELGVNRSATRYLAVERMDGGFLVTEPSGRKVLASSPAKLAAAVKTWAEQK